MREEGREKALSFIFCFTPQVATVVVYFWPQSGPHITPWALVALAGSWIGNKGAGT